MATAPGYGRQRGDHTHVAEISRFLGIICRPVPEAVGSGQAKQPNGNLRL